MKKQRITYQQFLAAQKSKQTPGTVAWGIQRYRDEMNGTNGQPGVRPLGTSQNCTLGVLQRMPIGAVPMLALKKADVIDHTKLRQAQGVQPQTVQQDLTYLSVVLKYAGSAWDDCDGVTAGAVEAAKPFCSKHGLIAKSIPRERRPSPDELARLVAYFEDRQQDPRAKIDMVQITRWQVASGRRIGETCKLLWADWDREGQTIVVRGMKDPKRRGKVKRVALTKEAQAMLLELEPKRDTSQPRIFPYNSKSASAAYTKAKHELGIENLRFHDNRRAAITRWLSVLGSPHKVKQISGHETTMILERVYDATDPATLHYELPKLNMQGAV